MGLFSSKTKTKSESEVIPFDEAQLRNITGRLATLGQTPMEMYPEQMYAERDPRQLEALGMREEFARGMGGMVDPTMDAWQSTLSAPDVANNPYVTAMLEQQADIAGRNLRESIPGIESGAIAMGQLGSSRQGVVEALRERGIREALAQSMAQTQLGAYQQGLAQQRYGISAAPGMAGFGTMPSDILMGVGDIERAEAQRALDEDIARHEFAQEEPWRRLERQAALFNPLTLPYARTRSEQETTSTPSAFQMGTQLAGLGLTGMGMFQGYGGGAGPSMPTPAATAPAMSPVTMPSYGNPWDYMGAYSDYRRQYG